MNEKSIRIGIIGCGNIAAAHVNALKELKSKGVLVDNVHIVALCDRDISLAESFVKNTGVEREIIGSPNDPMNTPRICIPDFQPDTIPEIYGDPEEMLKNANVNVVLILTPVFSHHKLALSAISRGCHTLVEKPLAISVKAGRQMVKAAKEKNVVLGVAESFRYHPVHREKKWLVSEKIIGDIQVIFSAGIGGVWALDKIVANTKWRHQKKMGGGGISVDCGIHGFNVLRYTFGEIKEVFANVKTLEPVRRKYDDAGKPIELVECNTEDTMSYIFEFDNGITYNGFSSLSGHGIPTGCGGIYGSKGCIKGDSYYPDNGEGHKISDYFAENASEKIKEKFYPHGIKNEFALEYLDFFTAINEGTQMETSGEEGLRDLAVAFSILESSFLGEKVKFEDVLSGKLASYEEEINKYWKI